MPLCLRAFDGKHIPIRQPEHSSSHNINYKGFFSVVSLTVVDANLNFMYIDVVTNGSHRYCLFAIAYIMASSNKLINVPIFPTGLGFEKKRIGDFLEKTYFFIQIVLSCSHETLFFHINSEQF